MTVYGDIAEGDAQRGTVQSATELAQLSDAMNSADDPAEVTIIGSEDALKEVRNDFAVASRVKNLVDDGSLSLHAVPSVTNTVFSDGETVRSIINTPSGDFSVETTEESNVAEVEEHLDELEESSEEFDLRTAAYNTVVETLTEEFGEGMADSFEKAFEQEDFTGPINEVDVFLMLAAAHEVQLYDISKWGEDIGVASKATFSRSKTELEDMEFIDTEKVPIDVGRPRLRLMLHESIDADSAEEAVSLVAAAQA